MRQSLLFTFLTLMFLTRTLAEDATAASVCSPMSTNLLPTVTLSSCLGEGTMGVSIILPTDISAASPEGNSDQPNLSPTGLSTISASHPAAESFQSAPGTAKVSGPILAAASISSFHVIIMNIGYFMVFIFICL